VVAEVALGGCGCVHLWSEVRWKILDGGGGLVIFDDLRLGVGITVKAKQYTPCVLSYGETAYL
jgi:hypothetical protein